MTRASLRLVGLSSTIRIGSFAIGLSEDSNPRQDRRECAAFAVLARDLDAPEMRLDQPLRQRAAETGALVTLRRAGVELLELDEQFRHVVGGNPDARILNLDPELRRVLGADPDRH